MAIRGYQCGKRLAIGKGPESARDFELKSHKCDLVTQHWGVHLCWCGVAFNDNGEMLFAKALQRHLGVLPGE